MDTSLANGDFSLGSNGRLKQISGTEELFQRAAICLDVPCGSFVYDPSLGSKLHTLAPDEPDFTVKALAMSQEALLSVPTVTAAGVRCPQPGVIAVQVACRGESTEIEVKL